MTITTGAQLFCGDCGRELPAPGEPCPSCPKVDDRRRLVVARYQAQLADLRAIDSEENAKALAVAAGQARALVPPVQATLKTAEDAVTAAIGTEREAADRLRAAQAHLRKVTRAEQKARRDQAGPEKLTEALMRKRAAAEITAEVQQAAERAAQARQAAEQARDQHAGRLAVLEDNAVDAERAAASPPARVPPSVWTALLAHPLHLLLLPDLGAEGKALVGAQLATLARLAGVADELRAEGRAQLEAELADPTRQPAFAQPLGNGNVMAVPNPLHPATPQQFHPPGKP